VSRDRKSISDRIVLILSSIGSISFTANSCARRSKFPLFAQRIEAVSRAARYEIWQKARRPILIDGFAA